MDLTGPTNTCKSCFKTFSTETNLDEHLEWHNLQAQHMLSSYVKLERVEIFKCEFCTRGFLETEGLKQHQKKYYEKELLSSSTSEDNNNKFEKPFKCDVCGWRFVKESTLEAHTILHKPFPHKCECGIGYYKKCDLDTHRRLVHPIFKTIYPSAPKVKIALKIKTEETVKYKQDETESESEPERADDKHDYRPSTKLSVGPRLKATLKYKQQNNVSENKVNKKKQIKRDDKDLVVEKDELGRYICPICAKTYTIKRNLKIHMAVHTGMEYKCDECDKQFPCKERLSIHKLMHLDVRNWECHVCKKKFRSKKAVDTHMVVHTGDRPYACNLCPKKFTQSGARNLHLLRHTGVKNFECVKCNKKFYTLGSYKLHERVHTGEKPYECKHCGKCFSDPSAHKRHELIHTGLKPHQCQLCPKSFCDPSALFVHTRRHQNWTVQCPSCDKLFRSRDGMRHHFKINHKTLTKEDKFECDYCGKDFTLKNNLVSHIKLMHLKRTKVICDICGQEYSSKSGLKIHINLVHLRNLRFKCDKCEKTFPTNFSLKSHMSHFHTKKRDRKYECDHCYASFCTKSLLYNHIISKHLGIKCKECKKAFSTSHKLREHKLKGCRKCPICHVVISEKKLLREHFTVHHLPKKDRPIFECDYCSKQFSIRSNLRKHIKLVHEPVVLKYFCDHCNDAFPKKSAILDHIWDKHMVSLYCNVCMKRFFNDSEFQQHKRVGCNLKQLPCDICEKVYTTSSGLLAHLATHGAKTKQCDICGNKFKTRSSILRHLRGVHGFKK